MWDLINYSEINLQKVYMGGHYHRPQILCIKLEDV